MKKITIVFAFCLYLISNLFATTEQTVSMVFSPKKGNEHAIHVSLRFKEIDSILKLYLPKDWANETEFFKNINNLVINNVQSQSIINNAQFKTDSFQQVYIEFPTKDLTDENFTVEYDLEQKENIALINSTKSMANYRPIVQAGYFQILGYHLIYPEDILEDTSGLVDIKFTFKGFPKQWTYAGSLPYVMNSMKIPKDYKDYFKHIVIIGTNKKNVKSQKVENCMVNIVDFNGTNQYNQNNINPIAEKVMKNQLTKLWKDSLLNNYTITLIQYNTEGQSSYSFFNGTALNNAFLTYVTDKGKTEDLNYLFSHEITHQWIGNIIDLEGDDFSTNTWFREGFTDYIAITSMYKNNLTNEEDFVKNINHVIADYYCSPVSELPNDSLKNNHWKNNYYNKLPYRRGFVFAMYLNYLFKENSNQQYNLYDFLIDLKNWVTNNQGKKIPYAVFIDIANQHVKLPIDTFFNEHILQGKRMDIDEWDFKDFARLTFLKTKCNGTLMEIPQLLLKRDF